MKRLIITLAALLIATPVYAAPVVTFYLGQNQAAGTFELSVKATAGDLNGGLARYSITPGPAHIK